MAVDRIDYEKCTSCGNCFTICPMDVFRKTGSVYYIAYREDCMTCHLCALYCGGKAISIGPDRAVPIVFPY
jgi:NAD-dependent dihydropyrimidine dehydrogenase PreA subunit